MNKCRRGQAPYGFRWQGGALLIVKAEAAIRRLAAQLVLKQKSCSAVARELGALGHKTRRGGEWSDVQVARILSCPSAIGRYEAIASDGETIECEPLIARGTWERVQAILKERAKGRKQGRTGTPPPVLAGVLWCACGKQMRLESEAGKFACAECSVRIPAADIEAIFAEDFFDVAKGIPALSAALCAPSKERQARGDLACELARLEAVKTKRDGVERMYAESAIDKKRFQELHEPLEREIRTLGSRIENLRSLAGSEETFSHIGKEEWRRQWFAWPESRRRQIVVTFADRITVREGELDITYPLSESSSKETLPIRQTSDPTNLPQVAGQPTYIRLPKPGEKCPITGLSRAKLNELILPNTRNRFAPPVASKSIRQKGARRGIRLVLLVSLLAYLSGNSVP